MKINESLLENGGLKLYLEKRPSIFGTIVEKDNLFEIKYWFKTIYLNSFHQDNLDDAKIKLNSLLINAYNQLDEKLKHLKTFENYSKN